MPLLRTPPLVSPTLKLKPQPFKQPFFADKSCVLDLRSQRDNKWYDYSGKGNHGVISGAVWKAVGRFGPALSFSGANCNVAIADNPSLDLPSALTIALWIEAAFQTENILNKHESSKGYYLLMYTGGKIKFYINNPDGTGSGLNSFWSDAGQVENKRTYTALTFDGSTRVVRGYFNGVAKGNKTFEDSVILANSNVLRIGDLGVGRIIGNMDEIKIYNRVLTAGEIKRNYEAGRVV